MQNQAIEARLDELETRLAFQDDVIATLNDQVASQEMDLRKLWDANQLLKKQLKDISPSHIKSQEEETPPPHY
jgi:SlyX protein